MISNPAFQKEGDAINNFMRPERSIIGPDSERATATMHVLYTLFMRNHDQIIAMGIRDAEMTKCAVNAMLAIRISFMNEVAHLYEKLGVDVEHVRCGIGSDSHVGCLFLYAGCGYGGACFRQDVNTLIHMLHGAGVAPGTLHTMEQHSCTQYDSRQVRTSAFEYFGIGR